MLFSVVYWWGRREGEELHQKSAKLTRFILLTRKAVLHSSWYSSLSLSIYNCLPNLFLSLSSSLYLFACVAKMFAFKKSNDWIKTKSFLLLNSSVNIKLMSFLSQINTMSILRINVFRGTSSLETRCLTLKKHTVNIYLSKWKAY